MEDSGQPNLKTDIDYHTVTYAKEAQSGIDYLKLKLESDERRVFFDQAHTQGEAEFEDQTGHRYTLTYSSGSGHFHLVGH